MILVIRTDKPEAEIGLYEGMECVSYQKWQAHRELAETLHQKIAQLLTDHNKDWKDISGLVCFKGPGSFTGLRIGLTVANTLSFSLSCPIVATNGEDWIKDGLRLLATGANEKIVVPEYGATPHITQQKK